MLTTWIWVLAAWLLVLLVVSAAGRVAGVLVGSMCGGALVYFVMPPVFCFAISETSDRVTLSAYAVGLLLVQRRFGKRALKDSMLSKVDVAPLPQGLQGVPLGRSLEEVLRSDLGERLRARNIDIISTALPMVPGSRSEAAAILSGVLATALEIPDLRKVIISSGCQPGVERIWISALRLAPPARGPVRIGVAGAEALVNASLPSFCRASRFDNGFETIYQLTFRW